MLKRKFRKSYDLIGEVFGMLTVINLLEDRYTTPQGKKRKVWLCLCSCGNTTKEQTNNLCMNRRKSCGCTKNYSKGSRANKSTGLREVFAGYARSAKKRGYDFDLSISDCKLLFSSECNYCGDLLSNIYTKSYYDFLYNGIDRVDNNKGYTVDNVVSCCRDCNRMKMDMDLKEFISKINQIYKNYEHR